MDGRAYLGVARDLLGFPTEAHWRSATVNAYYALFLECREALGRWGFAALVHHNVHTQVRLKFTYAKHADLNTIGVALERCSQVRNRASYDLNALPAFASPARPGQAIQEAATAIALLDAIDGDLARRAAAVAAIRP